SPPTSCSASATRSGSTASTRWRARSGRRSSPWGWPISPAPPACRRCSSRKATASRDCEYHPRMGEPPDRTEPFSWNDTIPSNDEVDPDVPELAQEGFDARYDVADRIGEGGMGVVHLCSDRRIGREIALKLAREGGLAARFLREARVQGRLEHPAVVPVYDLGRAPDGKLYFTMKPVRRRNVGDILERQRRGDAEAREQYTRRKLLTAFVNVCLAVDFAHSRGVLHRDLKPANVMLGDFGEVYVLDWGLARIQGVVDPTPAG